jgi:c-di-GMP-binding flagellar brake protein YcgR
MMAPDEKRKYPRLILKIEDGFFGNFKLSNADIIIAPIVNISAGGLNMLVPDKAKDQIKAGDMLSLQSIAGGTNLSFLADIKAEVRWIKDLKRPGYAAAGCKFSELSGAVRDQLVQLVHSERMTRGQYD